MRGTRYESRYRIINIGAQQILKEFKNPIDNQNLGELSSTDRMVTAVTRLSYLCRKIKNSPKIRRLLISICVQKKVKVLIPIIDVCTRWNSTFDMLARAVEIRSIISDVIYAHRDNHLISLLLNDLDWLCIKQLIQVLQPLKEVTLMVSAKGSNITVANVLPLYCYCTTSLITSKALFSSTQTIYIGIAAAVEKLNHYYDKLSPVMGLALILDPRFKLTFLTDGLDWTPEWVASVETSFYSAYSIYKSNNSHSSTSLVQSNVVAGSFNSFLSSKNLRVSSSTFEEEYSRFY